jgi:hypothetical protein
MCDGRNVVVMAHCDCDRDSRPHRLASLTFLCPPRPKHKRRRAGPESLQGYLGESDLCGLSHRNNALDRQISLGQNDVVQHALPSR